jgi:hypothetical protein
MKTTVEVCLAAVLALGSGCARPDWIEQTLVTVDVTGAWSGTPMTAGLNELRLELEQEGPKVKGAILGGAMRGARSTPVGGAIVGTVAGDVFSFTQTNGDFRGELVVSGDEMKGQVTMGMLVPILLRRVNPTSPPAPKGQ